MDIEAKIEGVLLAHGEPITIGKLSKAIGENAEKVREALKKLQAGYLEHSRGFAILRNDDSVQLVSSKECFEYIKRLKKVEDESTLSPASLEVLAIVAYKAPITRAEIESIRGVHSGSILRSLALRGLVERVEISEDGRSFSYTPSFSLLKLFGIESVRNLPDYEELSGNTKLQSETFEKHAK